MRQVDTYGGRCRDIGRGVLLFGVMDGSAVGLRDKMEIVHVTKPYLT